MFVKDKPALTSGQVCLRLGILTSTLRTAIERGVIEKPFRVGRWLAFAEEDLPGIREALERAGMIRPQPPAPAEATA